jgi:hypothetical protein
MRSLFDIHKVSRDAVRWFSVQMWLHIDRPRTTCHHDVQQSLGRCLFKQSLLQMVWMTRVSPTLYSLSQEISRFPASDLGMPTQPHNIKRCSLPAAVASVYLCSQEDNQKIGYFTCPDKHDKSSYQSLNTDNSLHHLVEFQCVACSSMRITAPKPCKSFVRRGRSR